MVLWSVQCVNFALHLFTGIIELLREALSHLHELPRVNNRASCVLVNASRYGLPFCWFVSLRQTCLQYCLVQL